MTDINPIYSSYVMPTGKYDVVGFRLNVTNVFDGIIAALLVGAPVVMKLTIDYKVWVVCRQSNGSMRSPPISALRFSVRQHGGAFPNVGETPITNAALAQKNIAPFAMGISYSDTNLTKIVWKNFVTGSPYLFRLPDVGLNCLGLAVRAPENVSNNAACDSH